MIVMPDGRTMMRTVRDRAMLDELVKKGKPLEAGQMIVMSGGKTYIVEDSRMPDGKMLTEMLILMSAD